MMNASPSPLNVTEMKDVRVGKGVKDTLENVSTNQTARVMRYIYLCRKNSRKSILK